MNMMRTLVAALDDARRGRGLRSALAGAEAIRAGRQLPAWVDLERLVGPGSG
jgi:hypothetical protein